jgi:hypothetical protein
VLIVPWSWGQQHIADLPEARRTTADVSCRGDRGIQGQEPRHFEHQLIDALIGGQRCVVDAGSASLLTKSEHVYVRVEVDEIPKGLNEDDQPDLPPGSVAA